MHGLMRSALLLFALVCTMAPGLEARQDFTVAPQGPRFLLESAGAAEPVLVEPSRVPMLLQRVTVRLEDASLDEALQAISARTGIRLVYSGEVVPLDKSVSLKVEEISVAAALTEVLLGANVDVVISRNTVALVRRAPDLLPGTIAGTVTEIETGEPVVSAQVSVDGRGRTVTDSDGRYRIDGVEAGRRTVSVTSIGYASASRDVEVGDGATVTVDFALNVSASQLDQIVVTVTGEQRVRELGHVVGRINADSLVKEAPISTLSELLTARVPGLQVFQAQGTVGGQVNLRVRGQNSLLLSREPIVIVDGVRITSAAAEVPLGVVAGSSERTSPLNDINPNDIESIEVVKGPSAATLYGTDAANGVIVINTKRGRSGPPRWNAYSRVTRSSIPTDRLPDLVFAWGTRPDGAPSLSSCSNARQATGYCTQDSVTAYINPLKDPELSVLQPAPSWQQGVNVSGGGEALRYYVSGDYAHAIGAIRMPPAFERQVLQERSLNELPEEMKNPNTARAVNLRANVTARLGERAEVQLNTAYTSGETRSIQVGGAGDASSNNPFAGPFQGGIITPDDPYGQSNRRPSEAFAAERKESSDRFFASIGGQWRTASWLATRLTVGHDLSTRRRFSLIKRGEQPSSSLLALGGLSDTRVRQVSTTGELGVTATARSGRFSSRTAIGAQYVRTVSDALGVNGWDLRPSGTSIGDAAQVLTPQQIYSETVTLGSYVEQMVGLNDRLFITGAVRVDGASTFGQGYDAAAFPKVSASWLVSEEPFFPSVPGLDELRIRYAYGASGLQPPHKWSRPTFEVIPASVHGSPTNVVGVEALGNPRLRPERVREQEGGLDAVGLQDRVRLALTWYGRRVVDQIAAVELPPGLGSTYTNLGLTTQHGIELELDVRLLETDLLSWDVTASHGVHRTELVDLGDAREARGLRLGGYAEGYPLGARFSWPITHYADADGDGFINPLDDAELVVDSSDPTYVGESTPPRQQMLHTTVGLLRQRIRLSAVFERRSGFTQVNKVRDMMCNWGRCPAAVDPNTPLAVQAEVASASIRSLFVEPGDFTRLREVTLSFDAPVSWARALNVRSATMTLSGRNLALWTQFSGPDPESAFVLPDGVESVSADAAVPHARSWTVRLDIGF